MGSNPTGATMKRFIVELQIDTVEEKTWDDVEWAVRDLFFDDENGVPNFTVGSVCLIKAEEIKNNEVSSEFDRLPEEEARKLAGQMRKELLEYYRSKFVRVVKLADTQG